MTSPCTNPLIASSTTTLHTNHTHFIAEFPYAQGDKLLLPLPGSEEPLPGRSKLKSTVSNQILSLYRGNAWYQFLKRKEQTCWDVYNLRDQVQRIILLGKVKSRTPFIRIAEEMSLRAEDLRLRAFGSGCTSIDLDNVDGESSSSDGQTGDNDLNDDDEFCTPV